MTLASIFSHTFVPFYHKVTCLHCFVVAVACTLKKTKVVIVHQGVKKTKVALACKLFHECRAKLLWSHLHGPPKRRWKFLVVAQHFCCS